MLRPFLQLWSVPRCLRVLQRMHGQLRRHSSREVAAHFCLGLKLRVQLSLHWRWRASPRRRLAGRHRMGCGPPLSCGGLVLLP